MISREEVLYTGRYIARRGQPQVRPPCVLLAEDDRSFRRYLEIFLKRAGYEVVSAADGLEAMNILLAGQNVDVVMTDAIMPSLNGYQLSRLMKNNPRLSHLPIVLLSALEPQDSKYDAQDVDAFLVKPVSNDDLLACLRDLISASKASPSEAA
jgi:CheY-like chemotaxis protein